MALVYSIWCDQPDCKRNVDFTPNFTVPTSIVFRAVRDCDWTREGTGDGRERHYCATCSAWRAALPGR